MFTGLRNKSSISASLWICLLPVWLAGPITAYATLPSWQEATAVNREGLLAAAVQCLSQHDVEAIGKVISREERPFQRISEKLEAPFEPLRNSNFINNLINVVRTCLKRGDRVKVRNFFQLVNQDKLIRGYGKYYLQRGGYGGPMVILLELQISPQKNYQVEVWYRLINSGGAGKSFREGPKCIYGTNVATPN
jgi:hypothetical protein